MSDLEQKIAALKAQKEAMEAQEGGFDINEYNKVLNDLSEAEYELSQSQEKEQRVQAQEEKVQSLKLPFDFNEVFDDPRANDMITELLQQLQRQAYADHNTEIEQLHTGYRDQLRAAEDREVQMQRQNDDLQEIVKNGKAAEAEHIRDIGELRDHISKLTDENADLNSKRDAAVRELDDAKREIERLNGHIDDLRKDAAVGAQNSYKVQDITASDKLAQLVKESAADKAARALARWNESNPELAAPKLEVPTAPATFPTTEPQDSAIHNGAAEAPAVEVQPPVEATTFPQMDTAAAGLAHQEPGVQQAGPTIEERLAALESKVAALEGKTAGQAA